MRSLAPRNLEALLRLQMQRRWWRKKQSEEESGLFDEVWREKIAILGFYLETWDQRWVADGFAGSVAGAELKLAF